MRLKAKRGTIIAAVAVVAFVVYVVSQNRGLAPYNWPNIATFLVVGISLGGIYAISALGLVVTYSTTGIFNFAHGAIGCFLAFVYWELRVNRNWPAPLALFVVIFVMAPLLGVAMDKLLMRRLRNVALVVQLMVTVGSDAGLHGLTLTIWKPNTGRSLQPLLRELFGRAYRPGRRHLARGSSPSWWPSPSPSSCASCCTAPASASPCGPSSTTAPLAGLNGARPGVVSGAAWALGTMTAAIAGILIAPETGMVVENLTLIIIIALAAAVIGQMKSLPWAFVGGMIVGLVKAFSSQFLAFSKDYSYANDAIPAIILLIAVLFLPQARLETGRPHLTRRTERLTKPWEAAARRPGHGRFGHGLGQRVDPVVLRHPLRPAHTGVARPGHRLHGDRTDHAVPRAADRLGRSGQLRQLRHRRLRRGHVRPRRRPARTGARSDLGHPHLRAAGRGGGRARAAAQGPVPGSGHHGLRRVGRQDPVPAPGGDQSGQAGQLLRAAYICSVSGSAATRPTARRSSSSWLSPLACCSSCSRCSGAPGGPGAGSPWPTARPRRPRSA